MTTTEVSNATKETLLEALKMVVADSYALMGLTHHAHWNVEGPSFFSLHGAFEEQYTELFAAVDELAERIRALGAYSPGGLSRLAEMSGLKEFADDITAREMVEAIVAGSEKTLADVRIVRDMAAEIGDKETEDMMIARVQVHEKTVWMLRSYLK